MSGGIVIVGGGFAGFWAALAAKRVGGEALEVTVVSRDPVLQIRPRLYEANPASLAVDLLGPLGQAGVRFVRGHATTLDLEARTVGLADGDRVAYHRLVVATGSCLRRPPIPGADQAWSIDTLDEAVAFDHRLIEIARTAAEPVVAILGAGFTGIELALELRDRIAQHGGDALADRTRIVVLERAAAVGPELGPGPRPTIEAALAAARIECRLGATVRALAPDHVVLTDGSTLRADAVVLTTGMVAAPFVDQIPGDRDALGRILVERSLRAPRAAGVFVAGDAAAADVGDGHLTLQSCQQALQLGRFAGENAARDVLGLATLAYAQPRYVTCLDLGRSGAVLTHGHDRAVVQTGADAKRVKRAINTSIIYPPAAASREVLLAASSTELGAQLRGPLGGR